MNINNTNKYRNLSHPDIKLAKLGSRGLAYLIDYAITMIPTMFIVSLLMFFYFNNHISQVYPFVLIGLLCFPYFMYAYLIQYPAPSYIDTIIITLILIIIVQTIMQTIIEIINKKNSIGKRSLNITVESITHRHYSIKRRLFRNLIKSASVYIFFITLIPLFFNNRKQTFYDLISNTIVIKDGGGKPTGLPVGVVSKD